MHDGHLLVQERLARVLTERLIPAVHSAAAPLTIARFDAPGEPVPVVQALAADYRPATVGETWGRAWATTWLRLSGTVPAEWTGRSVEAVIDLGFAGAGPGFTAEGLAYLADGTAVKGLHPRNRALPVGAPVTGGEQVCWFVEAAANPEIAGPATELGDWDSAGEQPLYRLGPMELRVFEPEVDALVRDLEVLSGVMLALPITSGRRWEILLAIERALDAVDLQAIPRTAAAGRAALTGVLAAPAAASAHRISAVGHAHIDSAWLWPLRETVRKVTRTAANVVELMDAHPEFVFAMSQAQQWAWLAEHQPALFERVRAKVAAGQFVPVGGMWVESDTNMPGGEALARQFVHGKRFFLEQFGIDTQEVWLPDSFGYSGALPQLVALSGSQWFLTQKISWSATNQFPHHTFSWEGIDGTRVFTHFPPVDTYNSDLSGAELAHAADNFAEKGAARRSLVPFGWGDGGGGPTREMLDRAARVADLEGSARVEIESPAAFFGKAEAEYPDPPVWVGELYLELHRGTYTSQARMKQGNRRSESLLREAELWSATAAIRTGAAYPAADLDRIWKTVLLHQFHDILPGSSIAWVHREARQTYQRLAAELIDMIDAAQRALVTATATSDGTTVVFNAAPHARQGIPAGGAGPATAAGGVSLTESSDGTLVLDNGLLHAVVDARGLVTSVVDLATGRELITPGAAANELQLHPDFPHNWDAWDVDAYYRNTSAVLDQVAELSSATAADHAAVSVLRRHGASVYRQTIALWAGRRRLDFHLEVDWAETEKFLKVAFPLDVRADRSAAETQFGHVFRPTHTNTSWEAAKFEICAHRFLHVGEPDFGVALVNDSTYGHDVTTAARPGGGTTTMVRLSLLRAPRFPDPHTDQGSHTFGYALVPAPAVLDAVREGYRINLPERAIPGAGQVDPLVAVDDDRVVVEAVKLAQDGSGDLVVRLYEAAGTRVRSRVRFDLGAPTDAGAVVVTDLLERPVGDRLPVEAGAVALEFRPFQIITLRVTR